METIKPLLTENHCFLQRCDARAKLVAFLIIMPILLTQPVFSWRWSMGLGLALLALILSPRSLFPSLLKQLFRLRWLFATLLLIHGIFTPGQPLDWDPLSLLSWSGLQHGFQQSIRLISLLGLAWILVKTTTPTQLLSGFYQCVAGLESFHRPIKRGFSLLAFSLTSIPTLISQASTIQEELELRLGTVSGHWGKRMRRTVQAGEALLFRLLWQVRWQEEALISRGFESLPFIPQANTTFSWRDYLLLMVPSVTLLVVLW